MNKSVQKSVKIFPEVWQRVKDAPNLNFKINMALAMMEGVPPEIIMARARTTGEDKTDS